MTTDPARATVTRIAMDHGFVELGRFAVEYRIDPVQRAPFLLALERVARQRRRDGAYAWGVFEDAAVPGRFLETFLVESWLEHLRQHKRVTNADRMLESDVQRLLHEKPKVTHMIRVTPGHKAQQKDH